MNKSKINIKRLSGYTLLEIIIAMILSTILLSLAIKVMLTILSIGSLQSKTSSYHNDLLVLHTFLMKNFDNATRITCKENNSITFCELKGDLTVVLFQPDCVVINNTESKDTLRISCLNVLMTKMAEDTSLVNKMTFSVKVNKLTYPFYYIKDYSAQVLFNSNE